MPDIRRVTDTFAVAPQLHPQDLEAALERGYVLVINNRPDGEAPDQPTSLDMAAEAKRLGMRYLYLPIRGGPSPEQAVAQYEAAQGAPGSALAFCRSGTRSITAWALGARQVGGVSTEQLRAAAEAAGYDLSAVLG